MKNYYQILDIDFKADSMTIKKAFRKLALQYHPDRSKDPKSAHHFIEITEAYSILTNERMKNEYDRYYRLYFGLDIDSGQSKTENRPTNDDEKQREWSEYGEARAKEYGFIPFEEFARQLLKEISIRVNYIPNMIAIFFVALMILVMLISLVSSPVSPPPSIVPVVLVFIGGLIYLAYRLVQVTQADYLEERKRNHLNKK